MYGKRESLLRLRFLSGYCVIIGFHLKKILCPATLRGTGCVSDVVRIRVKGSRVVELQRVHAILESYGNEPFQEIVWSGRLDKLL